MPNAGKCAGEEFAAFAGIGTITSYLVLFISFYIATYKKDGKRPAGRKAVRKMSQAPLPDPATLIHGEKANGKANGKATATGVKANGATTRSRKA